MKSLIIALIGIGFISAAVTVTCGDNDINHLGVCQLRSDQLCKTYTNGACSACLASADTNTAPDCTCATGKVFTIANSTPKCAAQANLASTDTCPNGWGRTNKDGKAGKCEICSNNKCKACDAIVDDQASLGDCTACYAGNPNNKACAAESDTIKKLIPGHGWIAACPPGYVDDADVCKVCGAGCAACTKDALTDCTACAAGHIIKDKKCVVVDDTNKCDASCKATKCQSTAANCTECADDTYEFTAKGTCTKKAALELCKEVDSAKTTECKTCMDNAVLVTDKTKCACKPTHWFEKVAYDGTKDPVVAFKYGCSACAKTCATGQKCKADGTDCEADPNANAGGAGSPASSELPGAACTDATLKASGCVKCADGTKCETCFAGQTFNATDKICACTGTSDMVTFDAGSNKCVSCTAKCTDATKKYCNIKTPGTATTAAVAECTGTTPAEAAKAAGEKAAAAGGAAGNDSNGILISAISMILAVILA